MIYLGIINDLDNEESYQYFVNGLIRKTNGDADEEVKLEFTRVYERPSRELVTMFYKFSKKFWTKQLVCAFRTTGGYDENIEDIIQIFTHDKFAYWSAALRNIQTLPISITGIAWEENFTDYRKAKLILEKIIYWSNKLKIELSNSMIDYEKSEFNLYDSLDVELRPENLEDSNERLLNFWQRNRLAYQLIFDAIQNDKNGIVELNISLHQILSRNLLFTWNYFKIKELGFYTCPVTAYAIFVSDTPIIPERHPLPTLIKQLWKKAESNIGDFKKLLVNELQTLIPKVYNYN